MRDRSEKRQRISADSYLEKDRGAFESTMVDIPEGLPRFKLESTKTRLIDVIPYRVGKVNTMADEGEPYWVLNYFAHRGIGADNKGSEICHAATLGKPCAICVEAERLMHSGAIDLETYKKQRKTSKRQLLCVIDTEDPARTLRIWDVPHFFFGKALKKALQAAAEDEEDSDFKFFADPEGGYTLKLLVEEDNYQGKSQFKVERVDFKTRKKQYTEDIIDKSPCLDKLVVRRSYDKIRKVFLQLPDDDSESESTTTKGSSEMATKKTKKAAGKSSKAAVEKPAKATKTTKKTSAEKPAKAAAKSKAPAFNKGDKVDADDLGICRVLRVSDDGKKLTLKDSDGEIHKNVPAIDVTAVSKPAKAEKPAKETKPAKKAPKKKKPVVEEEEDEELEDDEEEGDEGDDSELEDEEEYEDDDEGEDSELEDDEEYEDDEE